MQILLFMIMAMPFEMSPYLQFADSVLGVLPSFTVIKLLGIIGLGWAIGEVLSGRVRLRVLESGQGKAFAVYLVLALLASVSSGFGELYSARLLAIVLFMPLVLAAVRSEQDTRSVLKTATAVLIVVFPYAYRQMGRFGGRLGVGLYEANYYALMLVIVLPLAFVFFRQAKRRNDRLFWGVGLLLTFFQLVLTGSRGGFFAGVAAALFVSLRLTKRRIVGLIVMVALVIVPILLFPTTMGQRLIATSDSSVEDWGTTASTEIRAALLRNGIDLIYQYPLTGVGLGLFGRYIPPDVMFQGVKLDLAKLAHNTYVEVGAEMGIPGLLAFLGVVVTAFVGLRRAERSARAASRPELCEWAIALQASLFGYLVGAIFLSAQYEKFFWLVIFLSIAMQRIASATAGEVPVAVSPVPRRFSNPYQSGTT